MAEGQPNFERLMALAKEKISRSMETLRLYEPLPTQDLFHKSNATIRILRGGNRSGKSRAAFIELARAVTGLDPHGKYPTDRPLLAYLIGFDLDHIGRVAHRLLFRPSSDRFKIIKDLKTDQWRAWRPWEEEDIAREREAKPAGSYIPERFVDTSGWAWENKGERVFSVARLNFGQGHPMNGTEIRAFGSKSEPAQGDAVDIVLIDEDIHLERWVPEMQARLSDNKGKLIWSAFPHSKNDALIELSERAEVEREKLQPDVEEFVLKYSDNPYIDADEKRKRLAGWNEEERRARDFGEFITDSVLVYPNFHMSIHGIDWDEEGLPKKPLPSPLEKLLCSTKGHIPEDWTLYMSVDPGHTVCAVAFFAIPTPDFGDYCVLFDELYLKRCDAETFAREVAIKTAGRRYEAFIIDAHGGRTTQAGPGISIKEQYSSALQRYSVGSYQTGHSFIPGSDNIPARVNKVREWLTIRPQDGTPKLLLLKNSTLNAQKEFRAYRKQIISDDVQDKPIQRKNHLMDAICYAAAYDPKYVPPRPAAHQHSTAYNAWMEFQKAAANSVTQEYVNMGPCASV